MGYIDADAHVVECDHTWDFFDPKERHYRPVVTENRWTIEGDYSVEWPVPVLKRYAEEVFPEGSVDLSDPSSRIRYMDQLGVDVHVLFPTYLLNTEAHDPDTQAALSRSYNRWLAERTAESGGRLAWALDAPVLTTERCLEEMTFGKEHGAVSVLIRHLGHDRALGDENLIPIYEKALDLDLAITVHTGSEWHPQGILSRSPTAYLHHVILTVPGALWSALKADLPQRYPKLRIGFLEAGAMWLPHVLQEKFRQDEKFLGEEEGATFQERRNQWRQTAIDALQEYELYVAVHMDDDLPYLLTYGTENRLVHGTDFGHLDAGSDPNGPNMIATRADIDRNVAHKIVDENARRLYGIDPSFTPAPPAVSDKPVLRGMVEAH